MTLLPWLAKAGRFDVEHVGGIPHFSQPIDLSAPPTGILHTTEGGDIEGALGVFQTHYAPQFLVGNDKTGKIRILQLVQVGTIGAALETHNWVPRVQIEAVGFSKETVWAFDDPIAEALAALMAACRDEYGIPLSRPWADGVYGMARASDPHRNDGHFGHTAGWFGHGDCPAPDSHWDPGNLQWSKLFDLAGAIPASAPTALPPAPPRPCACVTHTDLSTVAGIQNALIQLGFKIAADGVEGPDTWRAIKAFQAKAGLDADGIVGPLTEAAIETGLAGSPSA